MREGGRGGTWAARRTRVTGRRGLIRMCLSSAPAPSYTCACIPSLSQDSAPLHAASQAQKIAGTLRTFLPREFVAQLRSGARTASSTPFSAMNVLSAAGSSVGSGVEQTDGSVVLAIVPAKRSTKIWRGAPRVSGRLDRTVTMGETVRSARVLSGTRSAEGSFSPSVRCRMPPAAPPERVQIDDFQFQINSGHSTRNPLFPREFRELRSIDLSSGRIDGLNLTNLPVQRREERGNLMVTAYDETTPA